MATPTLEEMVATVNRLEQRVGDVEAGQQAAFAPQNTFFINTAGQTVRTLEEAWQGLWDREAGYSAGDITKWEGHIYACIAEVPAVNGITGLGPTPGAFKSKSWFFPGGRLKPMGRIAPGQKFGGTLHLADAPFEEFDVTLADPENPGVKPVFRAHVWEFWVKEVAVKTTITGFGVYAGHQYLHSPTGLIHATIGDDGAYNPSANLPNEAGEMTAGLMELSAATAFKTGGNERYYLIVWGGTWQEDEPLPKQKLHTVLPIKYLLTPGAGIVEGPGNLEPNKDEAHWELML